MSVNVLLMQALHLKEVCGDLVQVSLGAIKRLLLLGQRAGGLVQFLPLLLDSPTKCGEFVKGSREANTVAFRFGFLRCFSISSCFGCFRFFSELLAYKLKQLLYASVRVLRTRNEPPETDFVVR